MEICLQAINANYKAKAVKLTLRPGATIFNVKDKLIQRAFLHSVAPNVTDLVFVKDIKGGKEKTHEVIDNKGKRVKVFVKEDFPNNIDLFDKKNEENDAYATFKANNISVFYYVAQLLSLSITINSRDKTFEKKRPLSLQINYIEDLRDDIAKECVCNTNDILFFNKEDHKLIEPQNDLKIYAKDGLIAYTYPIKAKFSYLGNSEIIYLIDDEPLNYYIDKFDIKKLLKIEFSNMLFSVHREKLPEGVPNYIPDNEKIHQFLKKYDKNQIDIKIEEDKPNSIDVNVQFEHKMVCFSFTYKTSHKVADLIETIAQFFKLQSKGNLYLSNNKKKHLPLTDQIKKYNNGQKVIVFTPKDRIEYNLILNYNGQKDTVPFSDPSIKVRDIINDFAKRNDIDPSWILLSYDKNQLQPKSNLNDYNIPPGKEIIVKLREFTGKVNIYVPEVDSVKPFKLGFTSKMKISSIKKSEHFVEAIPNEYQGNILFILQTNTSCTILNENETFSTYNIKNDSNIYAYTKNCHIFKYENQLNHFIEKKNFEEIKDFVQSSFKLSPDSYFIIYDKKVYLGDPKIEKCRSTEIFEVKKSIKLELTITYEGEHKINIENTKKVSDLINMFMKLIKVKDSKSVQLLNDVGKILKPEAYLYESFHDAEKTKHEIQARNAEEYTFMSINGKFITEHFIPSTKVSEVKQILKSKTKNFGDFKCLLARGRVLDDKDSLSNLYEDDEPIYLVNEVPEEIIITIKIKAVKDEVATKVSMIKGATALDVRYYVTQITPIKDLDKIILISEGNELNDDDEFEEDTEIIANLDKESKNKDKADDILDQTSKAISQTMNYTKKITATTQLLKETKHESESSDDSFLEYEDEVEDPFEKGNGTYEASTDLPDTEYVFKFKEPNEEIFKLQLPKDVTVKDVKDKICERNNVAFEDVTIFIGNQRLADFNILTALLIPQNVHYFTVKIVDLKMSIICTRIK